MSTFEANVTTDCSSFSKFNLFKRSLISAAFSKSNLVTAASISLVNLWIVLVSEEEINDFAPDISSKWVIILGNLKKK